MVARNTTDKTTLKRNNMRKVGQILLSGCILFSFSTLSFAESGWDFIIAPYGFVPSIDGETSVGRLEGADVDVGPVDIFKNLELGGMIQLEAHHASGFGITAAYEFMDLGGGASHPSGRADLDIDIYQGVFEGFGTFRVDTDNGPLDVYAGVRWWNMDIDLVVNNREVVSNSAEWVDPVIGLRWIPKITGKWSAIINGDIGGFGVSSDFTWTVQAGLMWHATDYMSLVCQYRALSVDYSTGTIGTVARFAYDTITHGPLFGFVFRL